MSEIIFLIQESDESGYTAQALGHAIFTQGETFEEVKANVKEAVHCHFDEADMPSMIRLHQVRDEVFAS